VYSPFGEVYVADSNNNRVQVFDRLGNHLGRDIIGFNHPNGVAVKRVRDRSGRVIHRVWVTDRDNNQVQIWDRI
jgi:DNA-binding beta-propeller fold protein YncE